MFDKIGTKIKNLAIIITVLGVIASIVSGIIVMINVVWWRGLIIIICGCLVSWIGSFFAYGFGEIIEKLNDISNDLTDQKRLSVAKVMNSDDKNKMKAKEILNDVVTSTMEEIETNIDNIDDTNEPQEDECPCCFYKIKSTDRECPNCGWDLSKTFKK